MTEAEAREIVRKYEALVAAAAGPLGASGPDKYAVDWHRLRLDGEALVLEERVLREDYDGLTLLEHRATDAVPRFHDQIAP